MAADAENRKGLHRWTAGIFVAAVISFVVALKSQGVPTAWLTICLFGALLVVFGGLVLELPSQVTVAPSSVVSLAALSALPHHDQLVGAMLVGACEGLEWKRLRARRFNVVLFNSGQLALAGLAAALVYQATGSGSRFSLIFTTLTFLAVNVALVLPAVVLQTGQPPVRVLADLRTSTATNTAFGILGLLAGRLYRHHEFIVVLLVVAPAVIGRTVYGSVARFRHAFERLESLYDFTRQLEASRSEEDPAPSVLQHVCSRLGVQGAEVVLFDDDGWHRAALSEPDGHVVHERGSEPVPPDYTGDSAVLASSLPAESPLALALAARQLGDGMVAPLRVDGRLIGTLAVTGTPNLRPLNAEDLRLLETLANHVAVFLERNRLVDRLRHDSYHDQLTGLPNRRRFNELVAQAARPTAIMLIDLDRFKEVNDTLGHDHGDLLLVSVADRLRQEFGASVVARLGGDEFGVLLSPSSSGDATRAAVALLSTLEQPFSVGVLDLEITASVGVAVAEDDDGTAKLLQQADMAMYEAKQAHSGWEIYSASRDHYSPWRLSLASDLRRGITAGELEVHFQPKSRLLDGITCGVEALVRWRHPRYGLLSPDQFIPVAENAGLIRPLTMSVLATSCEQQTKLRELGFPLDIAINLSVRSVLDVNLPDQISEVLRKHGVEPSSLTIEITEGSLMADPARTIGVLGRLAALGIAISIDDFGTGYSSLVYLKRLPATEVKIDRSFVSGMLSNPSDDAIVRSTVDLAHNLGLRAVAEGIEDPETWARLGAIGCDEGQGYFLSAPLAAEALLPWLLRTRSADPRT